MLISRYCGLAGIVLVLAFPLSRAEGDELQQTATGASLMRFDGLYRSAEPNDNHYRFYRFFPDGRVLTDAIGFTNDDATVVGPSMLRGLGRMDGTYQLTGTRLMFSVRRCSRCPVEEEYEGTIADRQLEFTMFSQRSRGLRGKSRERITLKFFEAALPAHVPPPDSDEREMSDVERRALDRVQAAPIPRPKPESIAALTAAKTIRLEFPGGGDWNNYVNTAEFLTEYPVVALFKHLAAQAGLTVVNSPPSDIVVSVDDLVIYEERVRYGVVGTRLSGRISVDAAGQPYRVNFKWSEKGPWFPVGTEVRGTIIVTNYRRYRATSGNAFEDGFVRTLKAVFELRK